MRIFVLCIIIFFLTAPAVRAKSVQEGVALYKLGNYTQAEAIFRENLAKTPNDYTAQYMLAVTLVKLQKYNEAKQLYRNVIARSNNSSLTGLCHAGLRNLGETTASSSGLSATKAILNVTNDGAGIIVNDVMLNNSLKTKFVLDTGATYVTISRQTAASLNISTKGAKTIKMNTASGYVNVPLVKIDEIQVKGLIVRDIDAAVLDLPGTNNSIAGLLGLSFLENFMVTVDRASNLLILEKK